MINRINVDVLIASNKPKIKIPIKILKLDIGLGKIIFSDIYPIILSRMSLISKAESDFIFFLDDDISYNAGLIPYLLNFMDRNIGACQGITYPKGLGDKWDIAIFNVIYQQSPIKSIINRNGVQRLYTNNTLIRTELVKDWKGNIKASGFEDLSLTKHIQNKGFICLKVKTPFLTWHKYSWIKILRNTTKWRNGYFYCMGLKLFIIRLLKLIGHLIKCIILSPFNFRFWIFQAWINISSILGSLLFILQKKKEGIEYNES